MNARFFFPLPHFRAERAALSGAWIDRVQVRRPQTTIVLDMESNVSETHGAQEGSAHNGQVGIPFTDLCGWPRLRYQ
jgi:hypothetical protein